MRERHSPPRGERCSGKERREREREIMVGESPLMDVTDAERLALVMHGFLPAWVADIQVNDSVFIPPVSRPNGHEPIHGVVVRVRPSERHDVINLIVMGEVPRHASYGKAYPCWIKR